MTDKKHEEQKRKIMGLLECSEAEAEDVMKWDKVIDQGGRTPYDLSIEAEKEAKKYANSRERKKPAVYDFKKRERKPNPTKGSIIAELAQFLAETSENACENVEITNTERQIAFKIGENNYELTLVQKRAPKK